jgi:actin-related protein
VRYRTFFLLARNELNGPRLLIPKVTDFQPIPSLVRHALKEILNCNAEDHPILVTEPAWNSPANRERMAEIMFEEFQVPAFYIANTGVLNASVMNLSLCWNCL